MHTAEVRTFKGKYSHVDNPCEVISLMRRVFPCYIFLPLDRQWKLVEQTWELYFKDKDGK